MPPKNAGTMTTSNNLFSLMFFMIWYDVSWGLVGNRDSEAAMTFMDDLAQRLASRVQLTSDGHKPYLEAIEGAFGGEIDYAILVKEYGSSPEGQRRYSPAICTGAHKHRIEGNPDPKHVSTSFIERQATACQAILLCALQSPHSKKPTARFQTVPLPQIGGNFR